MSSNGKLIASGQTVSRASKTGEAPVVVWHTKTGDRLLELTGFSEAVLTLAFSPDNRFLAGTGQGGMFIIWDLESGERVHRERTASPVTSLTFTLHPDSEGRHATYVLTTTPGEKVRHHVLSFQRKAMAYVLETDVFALPSRGLSRAYSSAAISHRLGLLFLGSGAGDVVVFSTTALRYLASIPAASNGVTGVAVGETDENADFLYVAGGDGTVHMLRGQGAAWEVQRSTQLRGEVVGFGLRRDGRELVATTRRGRLYRISASDVTKATEVMRSQTSSVSSVSFGPTPDMFATVSEAGRLLVWDLTDYEVRASASARSAGCRCVMAEGAVVSGWADGSLKCHAVPGGKELWHLADAHRGAVTALAVTKRVVLSGGEDGSMRIWALDSLAMLANFGAHSGAVRDIVVDCKDEALVHTCGDDKAVLTWNLKQSQRVVSHMVRDGSFTAMTQRTDHELELITSDRHGHMLQWDIDEPDPVAKVVDPSHQAINDIAISPDGRFYATACADTQMKVFDTATGDLVASCLGHSDSVSAVAWSPDQRQLVTVGVDGAICVWNFYAD